MVDALDADLDRACALPVDALNTPRLLAVVGRCEKLRRRLPAIEHPLINNLARQATPEGVTARDEGDEPNPFGCTG